MRRFRPVFFVFFVIALVPPGLVEPAKPADPARQLDGFDAYMQKLVKDWNVPGIGVAVVEKGKVVMARGYGYRDYGKKLPFTAKTVVPIASNTKLFTATAVGQIDPSGEFVSPRRVTP